MKNILIIVGSLRKDGFNYNLAKEIQDKIVNEITPQMEESDKYDVRMLDYANLPMFSQDIEYDGNKEVKNLRDNLKWANKIIIVSAEYNHSYPGVLKNMLDWASRKEIKEFGAPEYIQGKKVYLTGVSGESKASYAISELTKLLTFMQMKVSTSSIGAGLEPEAFTTGKYLINEEDREKILGNICLFIAE